MSIYDADILDAYNSIRENGFAISFVYTTGGSGYDPVEETYTVSPTSNTVNTYALLTKVDPQYVDGTEVVITDQTMLISSYGLPVEITQGLEITAGSKKWQVIRPVSIAPDNNPIIYKVIVRGNRYEEVTIADPEV